MGQARWGSAADGAPATWARVRRGVVVKGLSPGLRLAGGLVAKVLGAHWRTALRQHGAPGKGFLLGRAGRVRIMLPSSRAMVRGQVSGGALRTPGRHRGVGGAGGGEEGSKPDILGDWGSERHPRPLGGPPPTRKGAGLGGPQPDGSAHFPEGKTEVIPRDTATVSGGGGASLCT